MVVYLQMCKQHMCIHACMQHNTHMTQVILTFNSCKSHTHTCTHTDTHTLKTHSRKSHTQERLVGDCLLTSSFLSYTGAFTFNYRHAMVYEMWNKDVNERKIPLTQPCECDTHLLGTQAHIFD